MVSNYSWEEQTRKYLSEATSELNELIMEKGKMEDQIDEKKRVVEGYEYALRDYLIRSGHSNLLLRDWIDELSNPTYKHKDRLRIIGENNGGKVRTNKATDILFNNKLVKSKKRMNAYVIIQGILAGMVDKGEMIKIGPGEYQLPQNKFPGAL